MGLNEGQSDSKNIFGYLSGLEFGVIQKKAVGWLNPLNFHFYLNSHSNPNSNSHSNSSALVLHLSL